MSTNCPPTRSSREKAVCAVEWRLTASASWVGGGGRRGALTAAAAAGWAEEVGERWRRRRVEAGATVLGLGRGRACCWRVMMGPTCRCGGEEATDDHHHSPPTRIFRYGKDYISRVCTNVCAKMTTK